MNRIARLQCLTVCATALSLAGCSDVATQRAVLPAAEKHADRTRFPSHFDRTVPNHVLTWIWLDHTNNVVPAQAAPYVDWAVVPASDANAFAAVGIKTVLYTDPNRTYVGQPMYSQNGSTFAHDCAGRVITIKNRLVTTFQLDPRSPDLVVLWRAWVQSVLGGGAHYDAIFDDSADSIHNDATAPCHFSQLTWSMASNIMNMNLRKTIIYNGLGTLGAGIDKPPPSLQVNPSTYGGMLEGCYGNSTTTNPLPKNAEWLNFETTELIMTRQQKPFVCRGLKLTPAETSYTERLYQYASFLLTYNPASSIISEKFSTPSNLSVFPEETLVALDPIIPSPSNVDQLRTSPWTFGRQYASCYLKGTFIGACAAVVNPTDAALSSPFPWPGVYAHTLTLSGAGVLDGGTASVTGPPPNSFVAPVSAVIAIQ
jgi:hypothetical protein